MHFYCYAIGGSAYLLDRGKEWCQWLGRDSRPNLIYIPSCSFTYCCLIHPGEFEDTYRNLTLKTLLALEWFGRHYGENAFFIKVDTDVIIDIFKIIRFINSYESYYKWTETNFIFGHINERGKVRRYGDDDWVVSRDIYPNRSFPPYALGEYSKETCLSKTKVCIPLREYSYYHYSLCVCICVFYSLHQKKVYTFVEPSTQNWGDPYGKCRISRPTACKCLDVAIFPKRGCLRLFAPVSTSLAWVTLGKWAFGLILTLSDYRPCCIIYVHERAFSNFRNMSLKGHS